MELVEKIGAKANKSGTSVSSYGIFKCPYCKELVERQLSSGRSSHSCGCAASDLISTHGASRGYQKHPLYDVWKAMRARCSNPSLAGYRRYGGRGITVCSEWEDYSVFAEWAIGAGWEKGLHIDRIDNDGNYSPHNCQILTNKENCRKSSKCKLSYEIAAKIKKEYAPRKTTIKMLADTYGVNKSAIEKVLHGKTWA